jgi:hypothetical protein
VRSDSLIDYSLMFMIAVSCNLVASGGTWLMEEVDLSTSATNCYLFNISNDPFKSEQEMNYDFLMRMIVVAVMSLELLLSGIRSLRERIRMLVESGFSSVSTIAAHLLFSIKELVCHKQNYSLVQKLTCIVKNELNGIENNLSSKFLMSLLDFTACSRSLKRLGMD